MSSQSNTVELVSSYFLVQEQLEDNKAVEDGRKPLMNAGTFRVNDEHGQNGYEGVWCLPDEEHFCNIDVYDTMRALCVMQRKIIARMDVAKLNETDLGLLNDMFDHVAETLGEFNALLVELGNGSEALNDAINAAHKAFHESIETQLGERRRPYEFA